MKFVPVWYNEFKPAAKDQSHSSDILQKDSIDDSNH